MAAHLRNVHSENAHDFYDSLPDMKAEDMSAEMAQQLWEADVESDSSDSN